MKDFGVFSISTILFLISSPAEAGGCRKRAVAVKAPAVVVPAVVVPAIAVTTLQVTVPTFSYSYTPPAAYQTEGDCCQQLVAQLTALRGEVAALRGGASSLGSTPPTGAAILQSRCAKCHSGAEPKGEMALFGSDGRPAILSLEWKKRIQRRVGAGTMPPKESGAALTETEKTALFELLK